MLSKEKKSAIQRMTSGSPLMAENVKISIDDLINKEIEITDYDRIDTTNERTGEPEHFFVIVSKDLPGSYFMGGSAITKLIDAAEADGEDIRGEIIKIMPKVRTKSGQTYTPVVLV